MNIAEELIEIFSSIDYTENFTIAKASNTCLRCGNPAILFRDECSKFEYSISALCQTCQDEIFSRK